MLIYNVYNQKRELIGKLYVEKILQIDEEKNELFQVINKLLKKGITVLSDGGMVNNVMVDNFITVHKINENTFWMLENELIKINYIVEEAGVREV